MFQYTTLSIKHHHYTFSENRDPIFYNFRRPCLCLNTLRGSETTFDPDFLTKSLDNTLQTCVDVANEYLRAYKTYVGEKVLVFVVCINVNVQVMQCF